jgi:plastocyanin
MKKSYWPAFLALATALIVAGAHRVTADPTPSPLPTFHVEISNNAFSPASLTVPVGATVVWKNDDPYAHTVTMQGTNGFDSGNLGGGQTFSRTFTTAGTYPYECSIHPSMTATIVVANPSSS